jgi:hypothetical protein
MVYSPPLVSTEQLLHQKFEEAEAKWSRQLAQLHTELKQQREEQEQAKLLAQPTPSVASLALPAPGGVFGAAFGHSASHQLQMQQQLDRMQQQLWMQALPCMPMQQQQLPCVPMQQQLPCVPMQMQQMQTYPSFPFFSPSALPEFLQHLKKLAAP